MRKVFTLGAIMMVVGVVLLPIGIVHDWNALSLPGCCLIPIGFLAILLSLYIKMRAKKQLLREAVKQAREKRLITKIEKNIVKKKKKEIQRSPEYFENKTEEMGELYIKLLRETEMDYSIHPSRLKELEKIYRYVRKDYGKFRTNPSLKNRIDFVTLYEYIRLVERFIIDIKNKK